MAGVGPPPKFRSMSPSMRVDVIVADWRATLAPDVPRETQERQLYTKAFEAYLEGDYGFGLWCWFECDRLTNALGGSVREVTRVLGPGHYFGFSHRKAVAEQVPLDQVYRPRKGDMSTPRPDAFVLPAYQLLCVYDVRANAGDAKSKALLEIALGESQDRRRADAYMKHYERFHDLLVRSTLATPPMPPLPETPAPAPKKPKSARAA